VVSNQSFGRPQQQIKQTTTGNMDYEGQRLAELLFQWIICSFGAVGWVIGYINQDFYHTFYVWLVAVVISVIVSNLRIR
jgi:Microsomal signal peptidase 12 kDa subunit (SPC12)